MPLAIADKVATSLKDGRALRRSDIEALLTAIDLLWMQARRSGSRAPLSATPEQKRAYMRSYMRAWRSKRRAIASHTLPNR